MDEKVRKSGENDHERLTPAAIQTTANDFARKPIEQRISSVWFVDAEIHLAARLQYAEIFRERAARIIRMMNHAVRDEHVCDSVREGQAEIIPYHPRTPVTIHGKSERDAASVHPNTANAPFDKKPKNPTRATTYIENK
jgi:hypothetical protein